MNRYYWRLPDGVDEVLPPAAKGLENLRRLVLDAFDTWGYEFVEPPVIEFLDSLLSASAPDMDLQTLKMVDVRSGRMLGLRADMTSQVARIDAHSLKTETTQRICYAGPVVHANPRGALESRVPYMAGAELFGAPGQAADAEVISLLADVLAQVGLERPVFVLGHVGIVAGIIAGAELPDSCVSDVYRALQTKSETDLAELLGTSPARDWLLSLPGLMGRVDVLDEARTKLARAPQVVHECIDTLSALADELNERGCNLDLRFDLGESSGYAYHTGIVFSVFETSSSSAVARGGRYDDVGAVYGRGRPATGFDLNLKSLLKSWLNSDTKKRCIWIDWQLRNEHDVQSKILTLRKEGNRVIVATSAEDVIPHTCDKKLIKQNSDLRILKLED